MQNFFEELLSLSHNFILIVLITLFYTLEQFLETPHRFNKRSDHFFNNFLFQIAIMIVTFFFAIFQVYCLQLIAVHHIGLFNLVKISFIVEVLIAIASLDFMNYWFHRWSHTSLLLWKIHRVHHSDTTMDSSTFFRSHPLEVFGAGLSALIVIFVLGITLKILLIYVVISIPFMVMHHCNIFFPSWVDTIFGKIFITPNMHKVHHSTEQKFTDSNFAIIFIFWDKLFGTYKHLPVTDIKYGLDEFNEEKKQSFWYLLKSPFIKTENTAKSSDEDKNTSQLHPNLKINLTDERSLNV